MATVIRAAQIEDIPDIVRVINAVGLFSDERRFLNYFFKSEFEIEEAGTLGGFVAQDEDAGIVGYCGLTPCRLYHGKTEVSALQMGVLGLLPGYGTAMFGLMDAVLDLSRKHPVFANTANAKSGKLWTTYAGFSYGPERGASIQYALIPFGIFTPCHVKCGAQFDELLASDFWSRYLVANKGWATDRSPVRLNRIWGQAVVDGRLGVVLEKHEGQIVGYAILHARQFPHLGKLRYNVLDLVAIGDDPMVLKSLVARSKRFAALHGGVMIEYVGAASVFNYERKALNNTFIGSQIFDGWFCGPFDGDRSFV